MEVKEAQVVAAPARARPRLLVIDDDQLMRKLLARVLSARGYEPTMANNGAQAKELLARGAFDLILTDVHMPHIDGIGVLRLVRETDPDFPVILFTASPSAETAIVALQLHATAYLTKPIDPARLADEIDKALKLHELARVRKEAHDIVRVAAQEELARAEIGQRFDRALTGLYMAYQPIVSWSGRRVFGYEALVRSTEPSMRDPGSLFDAAEELMRWDDLCRKIRGSCALPLPAAGPGCLLLVNIHARELLDEQLYERGSSLACAAAQVVLEITERAHLETVPDVESRISLLRAMGFRIAIDDIGAGYSGLNSFTMLHPDLIKLDMALVRGIDRDPVKRRVAGLLIQLCKDLGIGVVGEGVETVAERDTLLQLECDLLQGYLFGRPGAPFAQPNWGDE
jgi:EAL domain-containing protein (putative c-di-GMP-specific phosphodiesterase class I)